MEEIYINGSLKQRVPHNLNVSFNYVEGESLLMAISNLAVSSGSACTSATMSPSHVLKSMGLSDELALSALRFSFGRFTSTDDVLSASEMLVNAVTRLKAT